MIHCYRTEALPVTMKQGGSTNCAADRINTRLRSSRFNGGTTTSKLSSERGEEASLLSHFLTNLTVETSRYACVSGKTVLLSFFFCMAYFASTLLQYTFSTFQNENTDDEPAMPWLPQPGGNVSLRS